MPGVCGKPQDHRGSWLAKLDTWANSGFNKETPSQQTGQSDQGRLQTLTWGFYSGVHKCTFTCTYMPTNIHNWKNVNSLLKINKILQWTSQRKINTMLEGERYSPSCIIREMQIKQRVVVGCQLERPSLEYWRHGHGHLIVTGENVKVEWGLWDRQWKVPYTTKHILTIRSSCHIPWYCPKGFVNIGHPRRHLHTDTYGYFIFNCQNWKQPQ